MRPLDDSCYAGSSVFLSTPSDLVRFAMAINSGKLLQPATVQLLQTSQRLASGQASSDARGTSAERPATDDAPWASTTCGSDGSCSLVVPGNPRDGDRDGVWSWK